MDRGQRQSILITGGSGFLGSAIAQKILAQSDSVNITILDPRADPNASSSDGRVSYDRRSLTQFLEGDELQRRFRCIIHLAWTSHPATSMTEISKDVDGNVLQGVRLLEICKNLGVQKFIFASSGGTVYGRLNSEKADEGHVTRPLSAYGASKLAFEHYLGVIAARDGFKGISLRVSNPYGPYQFRGVPIGSIATFLKAVHAGRAIVIFGDGSVVRDYIAIDDVAEAFGVSFRSETIPSGEYNIGSGAGYSLREIVDLIVEATGRVVRVENIPGRSFDVPLVVLDSTKFRETTGWLPKISVPDGIREMWTNLS
jgi:UDP-glucose 4-epimerase